MATTYLTRTPGTGSTTKSTFSAWIKRSGLGADNDLWEIYNDGSNYLRIRFQDDNTFQLRVDVGGSTILHKVSNAKYRDTSGWYHVVVAIDLSSGDKDRIYINGERVTSFGTETNTSATSGDWVTGSSTWPWTIGRHPSGDAYWNGLVCNVHFCDGYTYAASDFGSTDATTGEWVINTSPSVNYGTTGFLILKDGNTITDQSSNSNDFTLGGGTLTDLKDSPDDVYATMATVTWFDGTIANTGNTITTNSSERWYQGASLGVNKGKFYWEVKISTLDEYALLGITSDISPYDTTSSDWILGSGKYDYAVYTGDGTTGGGNGHTYNNAGAAPGNTPGQFMGAISEGDIITFALDCDSNNLKIGANGSWANGSDATDQTFGDAAAKSIWSIAEMDTNAVKGTGFYFPAGGDYGGTNVYQFNFGNGYFGTTAISSEGTNASGIGKFEYDVPAGYTALTTKGLQE